MNSLVPACDAITPDPPAWKQRTVLRQRWDQLAYFHWRYPVDEVQRLLPPGLRVDVFDGSAWIGLIPFHMRRVQLGSTPAVPYLGDFVEINVRTYVVDSLGRRSVWFFSLDVPRSIIVGVARGVFSLPYCFGPSTHRVNGDSHVYETERRWPALRPSSKSSSAAAACRIDFQVGPEMEQSEIGPLEHFLTARWGLITRRGRRLLHGSVDHARWPLHHLTNFDIEQSLVEAAGLSRPVGPPHAMYSPGVDVQVGWFTAVPADDEISPHPATRQEIL